MVYIALKNRVLNFFVALSCHLIIKNNKKSKKLENKNSAILGQILSVRRKNHASDFRNVACEGFDEFSARYPPHSDSFVIGSRRQILSVWRKYYSSYSIGVVNECFDKFLARYPPQSNSLV